MRCTSTGSHEKVSKRSSLPLFLLFFDFLTAIFLYAWAQNTEKSIEQTPSLKFCIVHCTSIHIFIYVQSWRVCCALLTFRCPLQVFLGFNSITTLDGAALLRVSGGLFELHIQVLAQGNEHMMVKALFSTNVSSLTTTAVVPDCPSSHSSNTSESLTKG